MEISAMRKLLFAAALFVIGLVALPALAGPTLAASPYPASGPQPASVSITVNGNAGPACTLPKAADGSVKPTCDLSSLSAGSYTIVMTVSSPPGCTSQSSPATCTTIGSASSSPFLLTLSAGVATAPVLQIGP
jgi:hypothetical protein